jgi:hypothetical protein
MLKNVSRRFNAMSPSEVRRNCDDFKDALSLTSVTWFSASKLRSRKWLKVAITFIKSMKRVTDL